MQVYLEDQTDLMLTPQRVLHIAPEPGLGTALRDIHGEGYISGDLLSKEAMMVLDVTNLPFPDGSFDVALCAHVFEHVRDDVAAAAEIYRVLSPGGWALLDAPVDYDLATTYEDWSVTSRRGRARVFGQWDHVRIYGRDYTDLLTSPGFDVSVDPAPLGPERVRQYGLRADDHIYLCRKLP